MTADRPAPRKQPAMNNPYATQTQIEARIASRLASPERIRRALRRAVPHVWRERKAKHERAGANDASPTPLCETTGGSILDPRDFANYRRPPSHTARSPTPTPPATSHQPAQTSTPPTA